MALPEKRKVDSGIAGGSQKLVRGSKRMEDLKQDQVGSFVTSTGTGNLDVFIRYSTGGGGGAVYRS